MYESTQGVPERQTDHLQIVLEAGKRYESQQKSYRDVG